MKRCVIYARVSSKEQEREGYSIPAQLKLLREYATKNQFEIVHEYVEAESAKKAGRVQFNLMLDYLKKNKKACSDLLVEKTDRLYRNISDWVVVDHCEITIHMVKEGVTVGLNSRSSDKFMHGIRVLMAKQYIDNLSEEVKKGLTQKASQGEWPGAPQVGYLKDMSTGKLVPDPNKASHTQKTFEWYASGNFSLETLSVKLRESGLISRKSGAINKAGIHRILTNPIYQGEFIWKGKLYPGIHTPIVSRELFAKVQKQLSKSGHEYHTPRTFAFAGLVKCGLCGCSMTPEIKKGKYIYYRCTQFHGKCGNTYIREEKLTELLGNVVKQISISREVLEDTKSALKASRKDVVAYREQALVTTQARINRLLTLIDQAYEDKLTGVIATETWERKNLQWQSELNEAKVEREKLYSANESSYDLGCRILDLASTSHGRFMKHTAEEKRCLLDTVLSNCTFTRGTLCPTYKKPFDILAKGDPCIVIRGRRDSNSRPPA